jgi:cytochrome oxidase Cu insertion factor (SCO1/SenC/PrrC family)
LIDYVILYTFLVSSILFICLFVSLRSKWKKTLLVKPPGPNESKDIDSFAPNFNLKASNGNTYQFKTLINDGIILVFVDSLCPHCENNLDEFLYEVGYKYNKNFIVICGESDPDQCKKISELYDDQFLVLQGDMKLFDEYKISYLPTFIYVDKNQFIKEKSPILYKFKAM